MASKIGMEFFQGAKNLDPGEFLRGRDLRNIHVGIEHGPTGTTYNRMAVPWAGAAYTLANGSWTQVAGRDDALTGEEMEEQYPNITAVWREFSRAMQNRGDSNGSWQVLIGDLKQAAQSISQQGRQNVEDGITLRAMKLRASSGGSRTSTASFSGRGTQAGE